MPIDFYAIELEQESRIVRYTHSGTIAAPELKSAWMAILRLEEFAALDYNLLADYRQAQFCISLGQMPGIFQLLAEYRQILRGKKQALLLEEGHNLDAYTLARQDLLDEIGFRVESFTRESAALTWLRD